MLKKLFAVTVLCLTNSGVVSADPLPEGAKRLSAPSIQKIYADKTAVWSKSTAYFAADGSVKGIFQGDGGKTLYWGKWSIKGNEICMVVQGYDTSSKETFSGSTDCWKWWVDAEGKPVTLWSVHYDKSKADVNNGYYRSEIDSLEKGDKVSRKFDPLYAKIKS